MVTSVNSNVNSYNVAALESAPVYDANQTKMLNDVASFQAALDNAVANPNDQIAAIQLQMAGAKVSADLETLKNSPVQADKDMASAFELLSTSEVDQILADSAAGDTVAVENDVYAMSNDGTLGAADRGLSSFMAMYPR